MTSRSTPRRGKSARGSGYNLKREELAAEVRRLREQGWQTWELRQRFDLSVLSDGEVEQ